MPTRTPGKLFIIIPKPIPITCGFMVLEVDEDQGRMLKQRGMATVYDTSAQAYTVCKKMNEKEKK